MVNVDILKFLTIWVVIRYVSWMCPRPRRFTWKRHYLVKYGKFGSRGQVPRRVWPCDGKHRGRQSPRFV